MTYRPALYCTRRPGPPLDRFVERLWYWECEPLAHMKDRMMPDGSCGLVINLYEDETRSYSGAADDVIERYPGAVLCGTYSRYFVIDTHEQRANVGVGFRPGGTWPFFDPASDELQNQHIALRDLWGSAGDTLRERILAAPTPHAKCSCWKRSCCNEQSGLCSGAPKSITPSHVSARRRATTRSQC